MQFGLRAIRPHPIHMHLARRPADAIGRHRILTHAAHAHDPRQHRVRLPQIRNADRDRPEAADLVLGRDGAFLPWVGACWAIVGDEGTTAQAEVVPVARSTPADAEMLQSVATGIETLDRSIAETRAALASNTDDTALMKLLMVRYQQKPALFQGAIAIVEEV